MRYSSSSVQSGANACCSSRELGRSLPNGFSTCTPVVSGTAQGGCTQLAYNDTSNAALGVAVALQVLGNCDEDARGQRHVEDAVGLLAALFNLLHVLFELEKGVVLVVLAGDVGAEAAKLF